MDTTTLAGLVISVMSTNDGGSSRCYCILFDCTLFVLSLPMILDGGATLQLRDVTIPAIPQHLNINNSFLEWIGRYFRHVVTEMNGRTYD